MTLADGEPAAPTLPSRPAPTSAPSSRFAASDEGDPPPSPALTAPAALPAAVVELFTSEGCSSCPPADQNLGALTALAERAGRRVFGLEMHVDYWDDLGWADPFSSPVFSARQRAYAGSFGLRGIYTPQMVVNGREEFIGSHGPRAEAAIARALAAPPTVRVAVSATRLEGPRASIRVDYRVGPTEAVDLHLAVAIDKADTRVTGGENANRVLEHRHVVLAFETRPSTTAGSGTWLSPWPASAKGAAAFVVAYVSDPRTLAILGSDGTPVPAAN